MYVETVADLESIAEEIRDASRVLPLGMFWTLILNGTTGFIMTITFAFCITDLDAALAPAYEFAYIDIFYSATQNKAGATVMTCLITLMCLCSTISNVATASRQMFAFARDRGLPFSSFLCKVCTARLNARMPLLTMRQVRPGWDIPLNAVLVSFVITCLLSLINLGSSVAFNAIVSLTVGAILSSYLISISCVALRKIRKQPLPRARWSLGRIGLFCNISAVLFLAVIYVFTFFPLVNGPYLTLSYMNWSSLMYGAIVIFAVGYFFVFGRHVYDGPVVLVKPEY